LAYFQTENPNLGKFWRGLAIEDIGIFYSHLVYFTVIWSILRSFGLFYGHLVYFTAIWSILWLFSIFFPFWYVVPKKSGNPGQGELRMTLYRNGHFLKNSEKSFLHPENQPHINSLKIVVK
jgi:hypothetical protein